MSPWCVRMVQKGKDNTPELIRAQHAVGKTQPKAADFPVFETLHQAFNKRKTCIVPKKGFKRAITFSWKSTATHRRSDLSRSGGKLTSGNIASDTRFSQESQVLKFSKMGNFYHLLQWTSCYLRFDTEVDLSGPGPGGKLTSGDIYCIRYSFLPRISCFKIFKNGQFILSFICTQWFSCYLWFNL